MTARFRRLIPSWQALPIALCYSLAFPPYDLPFLIFPCFVLWLALLERRKSWREALKDGLWISQIITWLSFTWVAYSIRQFGGLPLPIAYALLVLFGVICQPQFWLFAPIAFFIRRSFPAVGVRRGLAFSLGYAAFDYGLPKLFVDTAGHAFYASSWLRQVADLGGAPLLTFLVVFLSFAAWSWMEAALRKREMGPGLLPWLRGSVWGAQEVKFLLSIAGVLGVAWAGYGFFRAEDIRKRVEAVSDHLQLAVIQANIGDFDKIAAEEGALGAADEILRRYFALSDDALRLSPRPQALIWPETAYPSTFRTAMTQSDRRRDAALEEYVRSRGVPLLFGGYDHLEGRDYNAFFFLHPPAGPNDLQVYRKNILLWFGEYMPLSDQIDWLKQKFPQVGNFGRGRGPSVLEIQGVPVNPIICYEALFASYVLPAVNEGSRLILNITNDSWFGPWGEPHLHFALTVFRGIEARVPQLRATNTGISALILPDGSVPEQTGLFEAKVLNARVPLLATPIWTLMKTWGDWFAPFAGLCAALMLAWRHWKLRSEERSG
jgi:apolipoprotein N-acyltransferase